MASLLGDSLNIPSTGITADGAIDYSLAGPQKLLEEGYGAVQDTFGGTGFFVRQGQGSASYASQATPTVNTSRYTAHAIRQELGEPAAAENTYHKVTLAAADDGLSFGESIEFDIMPEVTEVRAVEYEALAPPQLPGEFQKYRGTKSVQWTISGVFTCRTREEAQKNIEYINRIRTWTMPYFGDKQRGYGKLGAPPPLLKFSGWRGLVGEVPVVITSSNWNWPRDCDWIPTLQRDEKNGEWVPFPTVMNVTINIVESFSALQFNNFDLFEFHEGRMIAAYGTEFVQTQQPSVAEPTGGNQGITNSTPQPTPVQKTVSEAQRFTGSIANKAASSVAISEIVYDELGNVIHN